MNVIANEVRVWRSLHDRKSYIYRVEIATLPLAMTLFYDFKQPPIVHWRMITQPRHPGKWA
jgi:hypothetical protein